MLLLPNSLSEQIQEYSLNFSDDINLKLAVTNKVETCIRLVQRYHTFDAVRRFTACESQSEENANPRSLPDTFVCPSPTFTDPPTRAKVPKSNEFVIRRESRLYSLSRWFHRRFLPCPWSSRAWTEGERERAWKLRGWPSLADRWKIHKLFQEKRRKSISNYSFL